MKKPEADDPQFQELLEPLSDSDSDDETDRVDKNDDGDAMEVEADGKM